MQAVIMAGGEGTRLRPITCSMPKPMAKIANRPIMEHILDLLKKNGITEAAVTLLYLPDVIKNHFGEGDNFGVSLTYFEERNPLGTAGGVKNCSSFINDTFLVISGDAACSFDLSKALEFHKSKNSLATLLLTRVQEPLEYGVVLTDKDGKIERFIEKPSWSRAYSDTVNSGIYIFEKQVLDLIPNDRAFDFGKDLFPLMQRENMPLYGFLADGYWCDIGSDEAYLQCNMDVLDKKFSCEFSQGSTNSNAIIVPPCIIGDNVKIADGTVIGPYAIIDNDCVIKEGASVKRCVLGQGVFLDALSELRGSVIGNGCAIKEKARIFEGSVLGDGCTVGKNCHIDKGVKLWPFKNIPNSTKINENIVWGNAREQLFDDEGITGDTGIEISPQLACKIGIAISSVSKNKNILISHNGNSASKMLCSCVENGILSTGATVYDLGVASENLWRFAVNQYGCFMGVLVSEQLGKTTFKLCGQYGCVISREHERKIESAFLRDDTPKNDGTITESIKISGILQLYSSYLTGLCERDLKGIKALVHCPNTNLQVCLENTIKNCGGSICEGGISIFLTPDGTTLSLADENGNFFSDDYTKALLARALILSGQTALYVPNDAPVAIDEIAKKANATVVRIVSDEDEYSGSNVHKIWTDGCVGAIYLLYILRKENLSLNTLSQGTKPFFTCVSYVEAESHKGHIMKILSDYDCKNKEYKDGIRLNLMQGNVLIIPQKRGKQFVVRSEANNMEIAKELCDGFSKLIKNIKEGVDF